MTTSFAEQKSLEVSQIGPLLSAISALPAAALVLGRDASSGAPLFIAGLVAAVAAYLHWTATDSVFGVHCEAAQVPHSNTDRLENLGYYLSWLTFVYGALSLILTCFGFVAVHSTIRVSMSVNDGMCLAIVYALAVVAHCAHSIRLRNKSWDLLT